MKNYLLINPPNLSQWLSEEEKNSCVMRLEIEPDLIDKETLRLDLNIIFDRIAVRRGVVQKADYYIGTTGGEIYVELIGGVVKNHTGDQKIQVNYHTEKERTQRSDFTLEPSLSYKDKGKESQIKLGNIGWESGTSRKCTTSFEGFERILQCINSRNSVKWIIALPKTDHIIQDFIAGNLYLYFEGRWSNGPRYGKIRIRPSDIRFFNDKKEPISGKKNIGMLFVIWRKGIRVMNKDGVGLSFKG